MSSVLQRRHATDTSRAVKYTPCGKSEQTDDDDELDEVAVVDKCTSRAASTARLAGCQDTTVGIANCSMERVVGESNDDNKYSVSVISPCDGGGGGTTVNGPAAFLGNTSSASLSAATSIPLSDRTMLIGKRLSGAPVPTNYASSVHTSDKAAQLPASRTNSIAEVVSHQTTSASRRDSSRYTPESSHVNRGSAMEPMTPKEMRRTRRKELNNMFGKGGRSTSDKHELDNNSDVQNSCKWTFVFDPSGRFAYWWSFFVSVAFLYNFWVLIYRFAFEEINRYNMIVWFSLDYTADMIYILDIAFRFRTAFLQDGVLQTDTVKLRLHYMNSTIFYIDCLCLLPLDFLYLSIGFQSMLRCFRLVKIYRFWAFLDRTERHTNYPNAMRTVTLLHYLFVIYHWNACLLHIVDERIDRKDNWLDTVNKTDVLTEYLHSLYWSTLTLTTIGKLPKPISKGEYVFVILQFVIALLLFAAILGHVANIVTSISAGRKEFQTRLDLVKTYMSMRRVPIQLQDRVIRWFDYLWLSKKSLDEEQTLSLLPDKLKAEIALHVHLDTLRQVEIFQNTEAGFLCELVLKLKPVLFSPGDYICRNGEVGKEMYIVNRGKLQVVMANGKTVLALLKAGSYFGEISILNMGNAGNRRTASVRSVGYSDLFCLSKKSLWEVLKDYPTARVRLEAIAVKRLQRYKKAPIEKVVIPRSKSTPGLIESMGQVPLEEMHVENTCSPYLGNRTKLSNSTLNSLASERCLLPADANDTARSSSSSARGVPSTRAAVTGTYAAATTSDDLTASRTVSSIASCSGGEMTPRNTLCAETGLYASTPPVSPRSLCTDVPVAIPPRTVQHTQQQQQQQQLAHNGSYPVPAVVTSVNLTALPQRSLSPEHRSAFAPPPPHASRSAFAAMEPPPAVNAASAAAPASAPFFYLQPGDIAHSRSMCDMEPQLAAGPLSPPSIVVASGSVGSMTANDTPNEILLQEITRLRERLHTLETENTSMSLKLNQQQWELDHRLSEIEMQICGSGESNGSGSDDRSIVGNKESVI